MRLRTASGWGLRAGERGAASSEGGVDLRSSLELLLLWGWAAAACERGGGQAAAGPGVGRPPWQGDDTACRCSAIYAGAQGRSGETGSRRGEGVGANARGGDKSLGWCSWGSLPSLVGGGRASAAVARRPIDAVAGRRAQNTYTYASTAVRASPSSSSLRGLAVELNCVSVPRVVIH